MRIARFVDEQILPVEQDRASYDAYEKIALAPLEKLRAKAQSEGLWCLQLKSSSGGMELGRVGMAVCYEEMQRSIFGPVVFNSAAPDDGNMLVLEQVGTLAQQKRWLTPIVSGSVRSAFAMTEPHPGGGSDPSTIQTVAKRDGDTYRITGNKWFITGAGETEHSILVAKTSDDAHKGLTAFLFDRNQTGWNITRRIPIMGPEEYGGHCELTFDGLEVSKENILLNEGDGLKVTQIRFGTAPLTHCMRWLGLVKKCVEIATDYAQNREGSGQRLIERKSIKLMLGEHAMLIEVGRLLVMKAAWALNQGCFARKEVSMAKVHVANLLHKAADTAVQIYGARGYSKYTPVEWIYRYARQARLVDGADKVHKMVLERMLSWEGSSCWGWQVSEE